MPSPTDRFTRLQKIAIFLITIGEERAREALEGLDLETLEAINAEIVALGPLTPQEKAGVMIEFGDLFFKGAPLKSRVQEPPAAGSGAQPADAGPRGAVSSRSRVARDAPPQQPPASPRTAAPAPPEQQPDPASQVDATLDRLKRNVDPGKIDWGRAGYDFGEGFAGPSGTRR